MDNFLDFLDEAEDTDGTPEAEDENPDVEQEAQADESDTDGDPDEGDQAEEDESEEDGDDEGLDVIDIDGEEVTLDQIRDWKRGTLREQDYTKKTQALAEERKTLQSKLDSVSGVSDALLSSEKEIKKLIVSDLDDINLDDLRSEDYPEYLKVKEDIKEREAKFEELKKTALKAKQELIAEEQKVVSDLLGWDNPEKRESDIKAYQDFASDTGLTAKDAESVTSAKVMASLIELAQLKKAAKKPLPKAKPKKVKFKSSSSKPAQPKPLNKQDRHNSYFD